MTTGRPRTIVITPAGREYLAAMRARHGAADTVTVPGWVIMDALQAPADPEDDGAAGVDKAGRDMVE